MPNIRKWSTTATGNASIAGGVTTINWAEQQPAATVNNSMREASAQLRSLYKPSEWGWVEHSSTASVASQTTVKVAANVTTDYTSGRRIRLTGGSTIMYGYIVSSSFTAETVVTLVKDSGSLSASMSIVAVSAAYDKNLPISGVYTPTLTNVTNLDASTAYECQYLRVGSTVTVSGRVDVDPTGANNAATELGVSLPVDSNFGTIQDCGGVAFASGVSGQGAAINADFTNNRARLQWASMDVTNQGMYFTFTYQVI